MNAVPKNNLAKAPFSKRYTKKAKAPNPNFDFSYEWSRQYQE